MPVLVEIREGTVIHDRFEVRRYVGGGGFGVVWHAYDRELERELAIKRLTSRSSAQPIRREEVVEEARKIARITHPNIVSVYDVIDYSGEPLIFMEFLQGGSLHAYLRQLCETGKWVSAHESVRLLKGILSGLNEAHTCAGGPIIHKDLKPPNILFDKSRQPKIVDFGLAEIGQVAGDDMTQPGQLAHEGTMGFMSPEQLKGKRMDQRSDLFNVGLIAYLLFASIHPFVDPRFLFDYREMVTKPYRELSIIAAEYLPTEVGEFVTHLLAVDPDQRFQNASEAYSELEDVESRLQSLTLQRALRFLESMAAGEPLKPPSPEELAESILLCKRQSRYVEGTLLYERSGTDFGELPEEVKARLEEDYRVCKKRSDQGRAAT
jgi:serine/threonine protein kinase